jgi:predicted site-specific integrase-resolvase
MNSACSSEEPGTIDINARLTATQAAHYAGVTVQAIINWRNRGHLCPVAYRNGRPLYRLLDVAKAELATRARARRTLGFWRIKRLYHLERMDAAI